MIRRFLSKGCQGQIKMLTCRHTLNFSICPEKVVDMGTDLFGDPVSVYYYFSLSWFLIPLEITIKLYRINFEVRMQDGYGSRKMNK